MRPDVELLRRRERTPPSGGVATPIKPPVLVPLEIADPLQLASIEIVRVSTEELVTSIAILSPSNKREPGFTPYREKRHRYWRSNVSVVELDLIRRGERPTSSPVMHDAHYQFAVIRPGALMAEVWPFSVRDEIPSIPVPLAAPDADVALDIGPVLGEIYDQASYGESIDYTNAPPPPSFSTTDARWMEQLLQGRVSA